MGLTECRTVPLAPARPARPGGNIEVWCDGVRVARVRPRNGGGRLTALRSSRAAGSLLVVISSLFRFLLFLHSPLVLSRAPGRCSLLSFCRPRHVPPLVAARTSLGLRVLLSPSLHRFHPRVPPVILALRRPRENRRAHLYRVSLRAQAVIPTFTNSSVNFSAEPRLKLFKGQGPGLLNVLFRDNPNNSFHET